MAIIKYKVLFADDEYWIREKIRKMIVWDEYSLEFLEPAENGKEVLERIDNEKPDILITDINMPYVSGTELIVNIKEKYPEIVIFVISGYDDFKYVKSALIAGAINYLLKPVNRIDLVNALSKAFEIISHEKEDKKQILKASSLINDRELSVLVESGQSTIHSLNMINNGITSPSGSGLILIKIHDFKELMVKYNYDMNLLSYSIKKIIKDLVGKEDLLIFNHIYRSNEFIIITEMESSKQKLIADMVLNYFMNQIKSPISIIASKQSFSIESIRTAYIQCVSILMSRKYNNESVILFNFREMNGDHYEIVNKITEEHKKQFQSFLRSSNLTAIRELLYETVGLKNCVKEGWTYLVVKQTVKRFCNIITEFIICEKKSEDIVNIDNLVELADEMVEHLDFTELSGVLDEIITFVTDTRSEEMTGSIKDMVKMAAIYIDEHYFEPLSLMDLSNKYNVESSYFSKMFRKEMSDNLMLYIAKTRMNKAKEFMKDSSSNLTEIAFMVGYEDYTYFSRVFKKIMGISPRDYRVNIEKK